MDHAVVLAHAAVVRLAEMDERRHDKRDAGAAREVAGGDDEALECDITGMDKIETVDRLVAPQTTREVRRPRRETPRPLQQRRPPRRRQIGEMRHEPPHDRIAQRPDGQVAHRPAHDRRPVDDLGGRLDAPMAGTPEILQIPGVGGVDGDLMAFRRQPLRQLGEDPLRAATVRRVALDDVQEPHRAARVELDREGTRQPHLGDLALGQHPVAQHHDRDTRPVTIHEVGVAFDRHVLGRGQPTRRELVQRLVRLVAQATTGLRVTRQPNRRRLRLGEGLPDIRIDAAASGL